MCYSFLLVSDFFFFHDWVFWFQFFYANILELYYSLVHLQIPPLEVKQIFEHAVLLLSWHDCDIINTTCQSKKRGKRKSWQQENSSQIVRCVPHRQHELTKRYFITLWRSNLSKCDIISPPLLYFYIYFYENIQSHKGNQIQSLTLVNTEPPHKSNTSSYQLM